MKAFASNRYAQAALVAIVTGTVAAALVYVATMTDGLDTRHTIKVVATAFLGPFSILVSVLPKITDLIVPQVRITSTLPIAVAEPPAEAAQEVVTSAPVTTVAVDAPTVAITRRIVPSSASMPVGGGPLGGTPKRSHHAKTPLIVSSDT